MKLFPSSLLSTIRLASAIADLIPGRGDTAPQAAVKLIAMADKALSHFGLLNEEARIHRIVKARGLAPATMPLIPWLLLRTRLSALPTVTIESSGAKAGDDHMPGGDEQVRVGVVDGVGEVVFGTAYYLHLVDQVYVSSGFDANQLREMLWHEYPNGIHLSLTDASRGPSRDPWSLTELPPYNTPLSAKASVKLDVVVRRLRAFAADHIARSYLLFGPQGTGKTVFGWRMGREMGGRTLAVEGNALADLSVQEFEMVVDALRPTLLLVDDIDGSEMPSAVARVRYVVRAIRQRFPTMTIVLTANRTEAIDRALLRTERIDVPIEFPMPDAAERTEILEQHLANSVGGGGELERVVAATDGLSHADIVGICLRAKHEPIDDVLVSVKLLAELAERSSFGGGVPMASMPMSSSTHVGRMIKETST